MYWSVVYICKDYIIQKNMYYCHQLLFLKLTYSSKKKSQDWFWKHWCSKAKRMLFFLESHCKCWSNATKSLFSTEDLKPTLLSYPVGAATAAAAACRTQSSWATTRIQKMFRCFWHMTKVEIWSLLYSVFLQVLPLQLLLLAAHSYTEVSLWYKNYGICPNFLTRK